MLGHARSGLDRGPGRTSSSVVSHRIETAVSFPRALRDEQNPLRAQKPAAHLRDTPTLGCATRGQLHTCSRTCDGDGVPANAPPLDAVTTAFPGATPVTSPVELTVAIDPDALAQVKTALGMA